MKPAGRLEFAEALEPESQLNRHTLLGVWLPAHGGTIRKSLPSGSNCPPSTTMVVPVM